MISRTSNCSSESDRSTLLTMGSSLHSWPAFEAMLTQAAVTILVDVRSRPRSRMPHFNQAPLERRLVDAGIEYRFLGDCLGGMPSYGPADYPAMSDAPSFRKGLADVKRAVTQGRTVLMCSEGDPLVCHRCLLVGRELVRGGQSIMHILRDGSHEPQVRTEDRLLALTRQTGALDGDRATRLDRAYSRQSRKVTGVPQTVVGSSE